MACGLEPMRFAPCGASARDRLDRPAVGVEELLRPVGPHPALERRQVLRVLARRPPAAPDGRARCPRPACRRRPSGPVQPFGVRRTITGQRGRSPAPCSRASTLEPPDLGVGLVQRGGERLMHERRARRRRRRSDGGRSPRRRSLSSSSPMRASTVGFAIFQPLRCRIGSTAPSLAGSRNLFACQLAASGPVSASPSPITHGHEQIRVVERGAVGMAERVPELAALVDRARRLGRHVARDAARERELPEELLHPAAVLAHRRPVLRVRALEPGARAHRRAAVARAGDEQGIDVVRADEPVRCARRAGSGRASFPSGRAVAASRAPAAAARATAGSRAGRSARRRGSSPRATRRRCARARPHSAALRPCRRSSRAREPSSCRLPRTAALPQPQITNCGSPGHPWRAA